MGTTQGNKGQWLVSALTCLLLPAFIVNADEQSKGQPAKGCSTEGQLRQASPPDLPSEMSRMPSTGQGWRRLCDDGIRPVA